MNRELQAMTKANDILKNDIERLRKELAHMQANLLQGEQNREEIRQKAEEGLKDVLYLTENLAQLARHHLSGLPRDKVATSDTLIDLVSQARDVALNLQGIWEAVAEDAHKTTKS